MNHVADRLNDYIDNELTIEERRFVDQHLEECQACREEANQLRRIQDWVNESYNREPVPLLLDQNIMASIAEIEKAGKKLEYGLGFIGLSILVIFALIHSYFNHGWKVVYAFYRVIHSLVLALPELVGIPSGVTISVLVVGLLIVLMTLPILRKLLRSMEMDDRRGWQ